MPGIRGFDEPLDLSVADMSVKVDTPEFSITAWVQVDPGMAVNLSLISPLLHELLHVDVDFASSTRIVTCECGCR